MKDCTAFDILCVEAEQVNPAIILAEELMRRDARALLSTEEIENAEQVLQYGSREIEVIERHIAAFAKSPPTPSVYTPCGF